MHLIFCLSVILTDFSPLFKYQNFHLFCVFVVGLIKQREGATLTNSLIIVVEGVLQTDRDR